MATDVIFRQGMRSDLDTNFNTVPFAEGTFYVAKDTGELFLDCVVSSRNTRIKITDPSMIIDDGSID